MSENKTQPTTSSVDSFLDAIGDPAKRDDARRLTDLMTRVSGEPAVLWGPSIIGFGSVHYRYETGREGDMPAIGFSPRAKALTLYLNGGFDGLDDLLGSLGKHTVGKGCLYLKRLSDADPAVLEMLLGQALVRSQAIDVSAGK